VPEQLTFELAPAEAPAFDNFLPGRNEELCDVLARAAQGRLAETGVMLWGPPGVGKSHLLAAATRAAEGAGRHAHLFASPGGAPAMPQEAGAFIAIDDLDRASEGAQANLFTLYNALAAGGGQLLVAAAVPPGQLAVRPDLRTRLAHGLVYEVLPLDDTEKPAALARYATSRGFRLDHEVVAYLLAHYPRDMPSLLRALSALDRRSLATKRPITVPFAREILGGGG
jgi:DnaA family protein